MERSRRSRALAAAALLSVMLAIPATGSAAKPAGNNGTIKIDGVEWDNHPNNEPHVGCEFRIDFYGFDEGDLNVHVGFVGQPPTRAVTLGAYDMVIQENGNPLTGNEARWDGEVIGTLVIPPGLEPHPKQGYHVKLTVEVDGATKHKTFWVTDCVCTPPSGGEPPPGIGRSSR